MAVTFKAVPGTLDAPAGYALIALRSVPTDA
ncbi:hypothetical protein QF001_006367 [Paraburkholderia youngii]